MRMRFLSFMTLGLVLSGCGVVATIPSARESSSLEGQSIRGVETQVERKRIETTLALLSGKTAMSDGKKLEERGTAESRRRTREYLASVLSELGYQVERHAYRNDGENVVARLMAPTPSQDYVLVGAHFDSVRNAGANDNGTGTVAVLEAARVLRQLAGRKVNVMFAWFDEEEQGLVGSDALAKQLQSQGLNVRSVHTLDMIGWDEDGDRAVEIERPAGGLWDYYRMVNKAHGLNLPLVRTNSGSTDHESFHDEGFEAVGLCEEWTTGDTTPHYHKRTDTYETVNFDYTTSTTRLMVAAIGDLACLVPPPVASTLLPHSLFPRRDHEFHL